MLNINTILNNKVMEVLGGDKELTNKVMNTVFDTMYEQAKTAKQAIQINNYKMTIYPVVNNKAKSVNNKNQNNNSDSIHKVAIIGPDDNVLEKCTSLQERMYNFIKNTIKHYGQAQFITCPSVGRMDLDSIVLATCDRVNKENNKMVAKNIKYIGIKDEKYCSSSSVMFLRNKKPIYNSINCADTIILLADKNNMKKGHLAIKIAQGVEVALSKKKDIKKQFQHIDIGVGNNPTPDDKSEVKEIVVKETNNVKDIKNQPKTEVKVEPVIVEENKTTDVKEHVEEVVEDNINVSLIDEDELDIIDKNFRDKSLRKNIKEGSYKDIIKTYKGNNEDLITLVDFYYSICGNKQGKYSGITLGSFKKLINTANEKGVKEAVLELCELGEVNIKDIPADQI